MATRREPTIFTKRNRFFGDDALLAAAGDLLEFLGRNLWNFSSSQKGKSFMCLLNNVIAILASSDLDIPGGSSSFCAAVALFSIHSIKYHIRRKITYGKRGINMTEHVRKLRYVHWYRLCALRWDPFYKRRGASILHQGFRWIRYQIGNI